MEGCLGVSHDKAWKLTWGHSNMEYQLRICLQSLHEHLLLLVFEWHAKSLSEKLLDR
jgi:hypothetical protein